MANCTVVMSSTSFSRRWPVSSSRVIRVERRFSWRIFPFSMRITGLPQKNRRRTTLRMVAQDSTSSTPRTVKIGTKPENRGIPPSCMGMAARFATSMVTTNSAGSISPICRLPMTRITRIRTRYNSRVRR